MMVEERDDPKGVDDGIDTVEMNKRIDFKCVEWQSLDIAGVMFHFFYLSIRSDAYVIGKNK